MLTSLILQLQAPSAANLPAQLGRAGQALLLRLVQERDAALASQLHDEGKLKPYTVSNLVLGKRTREGSLPVEAGQTGWLRFTGLTEAVSHHLQGLAAHPPATVELDGYTFRVNGATLDAARHPWAGQISYQDLAAPFLLGGLPNPAKQVRLEFISPTSFRSGGHFVPLPLPELVFGSLLDKWQTFAPIALHPDTRRFAAEAVVLSRYSLRTRGAPYVKMVGGRAQGEGEQPLREASFRGIGEIEDRKAKVGNTMIGFTGEVTFSVLNRDKYWLNVLHLLAAFAFFSGVGYQTGAGLGQTRRF
jgi:CRISPR-associated endoribonuclease Cas6